LGGTPGHPILIGHVHPQGRQQRAQLLGFHGVGAPEAREELKGLAMELL